MKQVILGIILIILSSSGLLAQQWTTSGSNIYNSNTGNVGIGTTSPAGLFDVNGAYYNGGYKFLDKQTPNPSVGFFNPIALALRQGKILFPDEEFATGVNSVSRYDNNSTGRVLISRENTITDVPNSSGYCLKIVHSGLGESPGYGGFYQTYLGGMNKTVVQIFRAKLPTGYQLNCASNSVGTNGSNYWLTNNVGTGKWEWYIRVTQSGNGGTFSTSGYVYVTGNPAPTEASPLTWYLASCTSFDVTNVNSSEGNYILNQNTSNQNSSFRISGNGVIAGNVLIGKTSQTNTSYKLDVNGNIRANKVVVNTTGADFVFDSSYSLLQLDSVDNYIRQNHHLPGTSPASEMQSQGIDVGENQTRLLQKIEELTLYIIQLNKGQSDLLKKIHDQSQRIAELEKKKNDL